MNLENKIARGHVSSAGGSMSFPELRLIMWKRKSQSAEKATRKLRNLRFEDSIAASDRQPRSPAANQLKVLVQQEAS